MSRTPHSRLYGAMAVAATVAIVLAFLFAAQDSATRKAGIQRQLATQRHTDRLLCRKIRQLESVLIAQLQAAKERASRSLPDSPERRHQLLVLSEGIAALASDTCQSAP